MNAEESSAVCRHETSLTARTCVRWLGAAAGLLLAIHVLLQVWHYTASELPWLLRQIFDVDEESSLPTWYAASALLLCCGLLSLVAGRKRSEHDRWSRHWYGLSLGFGLLSLDEIAGLHETLNSIVDFSWAVPGGILAAICAIPYVGFLRRLRTRERWLFIFAGSAYLGGAVGVEFATEWYAEQGQLDTLSYNLWTAVEEGLEMGGVLLFLYGLLGYMGRMTAEGRPRGEFVLQFLPWGALDRVADRPERRAIAVGEDPIGA